MDGVAQVAVTAGVVGLVVGLVVGFITGIRWAGEQLGKAMRREIDASRLDPDEAERIAAL